MLVELLGGVGVGKVTMPGLACHVGFPAINPVPRKMILDAVADVARYNCYEGGFKITISIPEGVEIAKKTFEPNTTGDIKAVFDTKNQAVATHEKRIFVKTNTTPHTGSVLTFKAKVIE